MAKNSNSTNFTKGLVAQDLVQGHLESLNFVLVCRNFQFYFGRKMGEIDLIMQKNNRIHIIEVKMRTLKDSKFGRIDEQITKIKLLTLAKSWQFFVLKNPEFKNNFCQFDAAFVWEKNYQNSCQNLDYEPNYELIVGSKIKLETKLEETLWTENLLKEKLELEIIFNAYQFDF